MLCLARIVFKNLESLNIPFGIAGIFMCVAIIFGSIFIAKTPLLWGSDETFHTMRTYQLTEGYLFAEHLGDSREQGGYGGIIPSSLRQLTEYVNYDQLDNNLQNVSRGAKHVNRGDIYTKLGELRINSEPKSRYAFPNTAAYSPVAYTPAYCAMKMARAFNWTLHDTILLMRIVTLTVYVAVVAFALQVLRQSNFKYLVFVVALLPMSVFQASIISTDGLTLATCLLFFAVIARALINPTEKLSTWLKAALFISATLLPLMKPGYLALVPLLMVLPFSVFESRRKSIIFKTLGLGIAALLALVWSQQTRDVASTIQYIKPNPEAIDVVQQLTYILHNPFDYLVIIARNSILNDTRYITETLGTFGFNTVPTMGAVVLLSTLALTLCIAIIKPPIGITRIVSIGFMGATFASWMLVVTTMYLTYSAVGALEISGIQGRYFLPLVTFAVAGIIFLLKGRISLISNQQSVNTSKLIIILISIVCLSLSVIKYMYVTGK